MTESNKNIKVKAKIARSRRILSFFLSALLGFIATFAFPVRSVSIEANRDNNALELAQLGQQNYEAGNFAEAAKLWQRSSDLYKQAGDLEGRAKSLINQSQALQNLGLNPRACQTLIQTFDPNITECNDKKLDRLFERVSQQPNNLSQTQIVGLRGLGDILRKRGNLERSQKFLNLSLLATDKYPEQIGATLLSLGNTERIIGNRIRNGWDTEEIAEIIDEQSQEAATKPDRPALNYYQKIEDLSSISPIIKLQAQLNQFALLIETDRWWAQQNQKRIISLSKQKQLTASKQVADFASKLELKLNENIQSLHDRIEFQFKAFENTAPSRALISARINFAQFLTKLPDDPNQIQTAKKFLKIALEEARALQDKRAESYALGYLGKCYEKQNRLKQAIEVTRQADAIAQTNKNDTREISYLWQAQLGNLLEQQGDEKDAIASYSAAVNTLNSLRSDLNTSDRDIQFDFLDRVKPVYQSLADLLLKTKLGDRELQSLVRFDSSPIANFKKLDQQPNNRLDLVLRTIESLQLAELDNFLQDPCSTESEIPVKISDLDLQAAVVYPIILPDRLEIIVSIANRPLRQIVIPVSEKEVNETLDELSDNLDNTSINNSAINILSTANPNPEELKANLETILPIFQKLHSWLIRPLQTDLDTAKIETLVFVLNSRLQKVPMAALYDGQNYLVEKYGIALVPSLRLIDPKPTTDKNFKVLAAGVSQASTVKGNSFPALVNVPKELEKIATIFPNSKQLLDRQFTIQNLRDKLQDDFSVIHLATHGIFSSNPDKNFLIAGDGAIDFKDLSNLLEQSTAKKTELLVLSACQTATGDARAILGLAGIAVRGGARSTVATLWSVGDASVTRLMSQFYLELKQPKTKKATALKNAQQEAIAFLKKNPTFENLNNFPPHPYFWASYVLVGNWL
jgi:CHAT domain-containing protein